MTIWIDPPMWPAHGRLWSHLVSDSSLAELHGFAAANGVPERGFEGDHYDVPAEAHAALVAAGARATDAKDLLRRLRGSGLRVQKRRSERVLVSRREPHWLPPGSRADVIASRQADAPANTVVVRLALVRQGRLWVVARAPSGPEDLDLPMARVGQRPVPAALDDLVRSLLGRLPGVRAPDVPDPDVPVPDVPVPDVPVLRGYVRNVVPHVPVGTDYPWPVPRACFAVWSLPVPTVVAPLRPGRWVSPRDGARLLGHRHWWPLFVDGFS